MAMQKVEELPNAKVAARHLKDWKKWTGGKAKKVRLANGWYAIYADTSQLNPAARLILGY